MNKKMTLKKESFNVIISTSHLDIITNNRNCKEFKLISEVKRLNYQNVDKNFKKRFRVGTCYMSLTEIIENGRSDLTKDIIELFEMLSAYDNKIRSIEVEELIYKQAIEKRKIYLNRKMGVAANNCKMIKEYIGRKLGRV